MKNALISAKRSPLWFMLILVLWAMRLPAQKRASSATRLPVPREFENAPSFWLSEKQLLFLIEGQAQNLTQAYQPVMIDIITGRQTRFKPINRREYTGRDTCFGYEWALSPNRKWLLWDRGDETGKLHYWSAVEWRTGKELEWPQSARGMSNSQVGWMPDSQRWVLFHSAAPELTLYDVSAPQDEQKIPIPAFTIANSKTGRALLLFGVTKQEGIVAGCAFDFLPDAEETALEQLVVINLKRKPAKSQPFALLARIGDSMEGIINYAVSPQKEQIAFVYGYAKRPPGVALLDLPAIPKAQSSEWHMLCTANLDGSGTHFIGYLPPDPSPNDFSRLTWTPDGKRLCFWYNDSLYSVAVE